MSTVMGNGMTIVILEAAVEMIEMIDVMVVVEVEVEMGLVTGLAMVHVVVVVTMITVETDHARVVVMLLAMLLVMTDRVANGVITIETATTTIRTESVIQAMENLTMTTETVTTETDERRKMSQITGGMRAHGANLRGVDLISINPRLNGLMMTHPEIMTNHRKGRSIRTVLLSLQNMKSLHNRYLVRRVVLQLSVYPTKRTMPVL